MEKDSMSWKEYVRYIVIYRRTKIDLEFESKTSRCVTILTIKQLVNPSVTQQ